MATEKRLIDANYLRNKFIPNCPIEEGGIPLGDFNAHQKILALYPTVDALEVVHGRWEDMYGGKYANPRYRCSVCKEKALFKFERDLLGSYKGVQALTPNCPYCMAKLDGERRTK